MKIRIGIILVILLLALCGKVLAEEIEVDVTPSSQAATAGSTIDYTLNITNNLGTDAWITKIDVNVPQGWSYTLDPDLVDERLSSGESVETTIHISIPSTASAGSYSNIATVKVKYRKLICSGQGCYWGWADCEDDSKFETQVREAAIPEFTTVAIPALIAIAAVVLIRRRMT